MKILFDIFATQPHKGKFHGGGEYAKSVFTHLIKYKKKEKIYAFYNPDLWIDPVLDNMIKINDITTYTIKNNRDIESIIRRNDFDKYYSSIPYNYYDIDFSPINCIFTIQDLRDIETPSDIYEIKHESGFKKQVEFIYKRIFKKHYYKRKKKKISKLINVQSKSITIIASSYNTKYSILCHFPFMKNHNIKVVYPPPKISNKLLLKPNEILKNKYDIDSKNYFLLISGNRWIKNTYRALIAFDQLYSDFHIDKKVLITGVDNPKKFIRSIKNKNNFSFYGYVEQNDLEILYKNAYCLVFPSLNEGFGYPPVECMKYGVPVLSSAIASVMEVCGDSLFYFNPYSIVEMKKRILNIISDNKLWEKYSLKSKERYRIIFKKQINDLDELCSLILKP